MGGFVKECSILETGKSFEEYSILKENSKMKIEKTFIMKMWSVLKNILRSDF